MRARRGLVGENGGMAKTYKGVDREQGFLLPPDVREWLPADHEVWWLIDAVSVLDTSAFHADRRLGGVGRQGYDPDMLLTLLIYAYANKVRSSRAIERYCKVDVAFRVITGNRVPDHTAIARFRAAHDEALRELFAKVVVMGLALGAGRVGTLAIDGTKIEADASRLANRTLERVQAEIDEVVEEAAEVDAEEDARLGDSRGDELPAALTRREGRLARLERCKERIETQTETAVAEGGTSERIERARAHLDATIAAQQAKVDAYAAAIAAGGRPGRKPVPAEEHCLTRRAKERLAKAEAAHANAQAKAERTGRGHRRRANTTDPDSSVLKSQGAWVQGYNCQAAFSEDGMAMAAAIGETASDAPELHPLIGQAQQLLDAADADQSIDNVVADAGYWSDENATANPTTRGQADPPKVVVPPRGCNPRTQPPTDDPPPDASPAEQMRHLLSTPEGQAIYARRSPQAEGPFGHLKHTMGFTRFSRRGRSAADAEWNFILAVRNLLLLHRHGYQPAPA